VGCGEIAQMSVMLLFSQHPHHVPRTSMLVAFSS
jgi:hypothetical protein